MAINSYTVGQLVRASAQFRVGATLTDPTSVTATHKDPNGVLTSLSVTNDGTGLRHADVTPATKGRHVVRWVGRARAWRRARRSSTRKARSM